MDVKAHTQAAEDLKFGPAGLAIAEFDLDRGIKQLSLNLKRAGGKFLIDSVGVATSTNQRRCALAYNWDGNKGPWQTPVSTYVPCGLFSL